MFWAPLKTDFQIFSLGHLGKKSSLSLTKWSNLFARLQTKMNHKMRSPKSLALSYFVSVCRKRHIVDKNSLLLKHSPTINNLWTWVAHNFLWRSSTTACRFPRRWYWKAKGARRGLAQRCVAQRCVAWRTNVSRKNHWDWTRDTADAPAGPSAKTPVVALEDAAADSTAGALRQTFRRMLRKGPRRTLNRMLRRAPRQVLRRGLPQVLLQLLRQLLRRIFRLTLQRRREASTRFKAPQWHKTR